jgi:DNA-binding XRE family transcriptional regulator
MSSRRTFVASGLKKGYSQDASAREAGVNRTYMSKLEKGGSFVGLELMVNWRRCSKSSRRTS